MQGYNAQAVVTEDQIIVAAEVTQEENDMKQLHPMLKRAQANLKAIAYLQAVGTALAGMPAIAVRLTCWRRIRQGPRC